MKTFIITIAILILFLVACAPAAPTLVSTIEPMKSVNRQPVEQAQLRVTLPVEEHLVQAETLTSEPIPSSTPLGSYEAFVTASQLSGNGIEFTSVSLSELSYLTGPFAYISRKHDQDITIYTMDVFTNHLVAEYEATQVEALNLFTIKGDQTQAKKNMALWCQAQRPQIQEEAQKGTNKVICFEFFEVE